MNKNGRLFLSDVSLYDNINGKFVARDPYIYNFIFSNFTVISSQKFKNEQLILHGVDKTGTAVFLSLLLNGSEFKSFLSNINDTPCFFIDK